MHVNPRARGRREPSMPGDVIGVRMRLEDVLDPDTHVPGQRKVLLDIELRVNNRCDPRVLITDQI